MRSAALTGLVAIGLMSMGCASPPRPQLTDGSTVEAASPIPAFPGAEGFGAYTVGGRGGRVILVTTLEDYGGNEPPIEGSLRAAVEAEGARNILFRVSGYIDLKQSLEIKNPYITIAGQSAPGDGVTIRRYGVEVQSPQTIIRHLRVRPGDVAGVPQDALNISAPDVIVDHCSVGWGTDETLSVIGNATNVTVQWCLISESLNESVHPKGAHGYGSLLTATGDVSIHHSAYVLHNSRNPRPKSLRLDFRNNLIYGYGGQAGYNADDFTLMNYVGNFVQPLAHSRKEDCAFSLGGLHSRLYVADNHISGQDGGGWDIICFDDVDPEEARRRVRLDAPIPTAFVHTHTADEARDLIVRDAGAVLPTRDAVDERILSLISRNEGRIINSQEEVGGWPALDPGTAPVDSDRDGLPDDWELAHGLDPKNPADQAFDADGDGYTNLEEFLNETDPREPFHWAPPPVFDPPSGTAFADSVLMVTIESPVAGTRLHYTTDGTNPDAASPEYDGPLTISQSTHLRALALVDGTETMPAFAEYEQVEWQSPEALSIDDTGPGLHFAFFEADDWDEGLSPEEMEPVEQGVMESFDLNFAGRARGRGVVLDGFVQVPADGLYAFYLADEYRSELVIGDRLVTRGRPDGTIQGYAALRKGLHRFQLRSLRETDDGSPSLRWQRDGGEVRPIPDESFRHLAR